MTEWKYLNHLEEIKAVIDDMLMCSGFVAENSPEGYRKAVNKLCCFNADVALHFERERLIRINEDFYGPSFKETDVPFLP